MSKKIVFIGGGSAKFVSTVIIDFFSYEELQDINICLMDINKERVEQSEALVKKIIKEMKVNASVESTLDQRKALDGADYVIVTFMVGGYDCYKKDVEIPAKYGVFQTVSDTTGPGAVMRILRTLPVIQELVKNLKETAPDAVVLNYANPMSMNTWTFLKCGHERTVGLCHSVQGTYSVCIAKWLNIPPDEIEYTAGGINHMNFYLTLKHKGKDLYPDLLASAQSVIKENPTERLRFELLEYLGYFPAEGPHHQAEYYPWFIKNLDSTKYYAAEPYWGYNNDSKNFADKTAMTQKQLNGDEPIKYERSSEYAGKIIHSMETGKVRTFYGNVKNNGLISNLPPQAIVEVPCMVSKEGISPCRVGAIPLQLAALMTPHIALHEMAVEGTLEKSRDMLRQAIQADPLTAAILTLPEIRKMTNELLEENRAYLN